MRLPTDLFSEALRLPDPAMMYELGERVRGIAHDRATLQTQDFDFQPIEFAAAGGCAVTSRPEVGNHWQVADIDGTLRHAPIHAAMDVEWRSHRLTLITVNPDCEPRFWLIIAETLVLAERFFEAVCRWYSGSTDAVTVFDYGCFERDSALMEQIASRQLDQLCLSEAMRRSIQTGIIDFFAARCFTASTGFPGSGV